MIKKIKLFDIPTVSKYLFRAKTMLSFIYYMGKQASSFSLFYAIMQAKKPVISPYFN